MTYFRGESNNIAGSLAGRIVSFCLVSGKAAQSGLFEAGFAGLADGFASSFVLVVWGDVADAGM